MNQKLEETGDTGLAKILPDLTHSKEPKLTPNQKMQFALQKMNRYFKVIFRFCLC